MRITSYRYPREQLILVFTLFLVLVVIALTASATVCASGIFIVIYIAISAYFSYSHHQSLLGSARRVTAQDAPELAQIVNRGVSRLKPGAVEVYTLGSQQLNAYTFGLSSPKVVVLYSALFQVMDAEETLFVLGHELGHVALGHTWLNSLVGGMAGIPASWSAGSLLTMAFLWWNRACEYSADRAGLLACGNPEKAITALIKLAAGPYAHSTLALEDAYRRIDAEDDTFLGSLNEALSSHPMLIRRIQELRRYASSSQYRSLQSRMV
jgi:Zn-dependent protease with chaperone function